ncbi:LLM class flavin-dependent oxidoreductase [Streptomyces sp. NPDC003480]
MTSSHGRGLLHLAAAVDQRPAHDADTPVELARLAERGALDFVTLDAGFAGSGSDVLGAGFAGSGPDAFDDGFAGSGPDAFDDGFAGSGPNVPRSAQDTPDALAVLARAAPVTSRIGLVPTVAAGPVDPCRVPAGIATLDRLSHGRAGWQWRPAGGSAGPSPEYSAVPARQGPPPRPRERREEGPPQGSPVRVVDATAPHGRRIAGRHADVALVSVGSLAQAATVRAELRDAVRESGREAGSLRVLAALTVDLGDGECAAESGWGTFRFGHDRDLGGAGRGARPLYRGGPVDLAELIAAWHDTGVVDGFHLTPAEPRRDLERLVNGTVALLQHRGRFRTFYPGSTLREHLGLSRPTTRHVMTGGAS